MSNQTFGETVRWRRTVLGLTQSQLAARIRVRRRETTAAYICRIERGVIDPRLSTVYALARALKVRPWYLIADVQDGTGLLEHYIRLRPRHKREIQRLVRYYLEEGGTS